MVSKLLLLLLLATAAAEGFKLDHRLSVRPAKANIMRLKPLLAPPLAMAAPASVPQIIAMQSPVHGVQPKASKAPSLLDSVWNENTKLVAYLGVWYMGNIYCKPLPPLTADPS